MIRARQVCCALAKHNRHAHFFQLMLQSCTQRLWIGREQRCIRRDQRDLFAGLRRRDLSGEFGANGPCADNSNGIGLGQIRTDLQAGLAEIFDATACGLEGGGVV